MRMVLGTVRSYLDQEILQRYVRQQFGDRARKTSTLTPASGHRRWRPRHCHSLIGARADRTERGCWEWPKVRDGYPYIRVGKRDIGLHRMVLEIKEGLPLGVQSAHHICANTKCVNPDHLQPVTHRDNTAEMLARRTYLDRIEELEGALMALDPNHPLLDRVRVA